MFNNFKKIINRKKIFSYGNYILNNSVRDKEKRMLAIKKFLDNTR